MCANERMRSDEGHRPPGQAPGWRTGVDSSWLVRWWAADAERLFPKRYRGAPPLFYPVMLVGLIWGTVYLFFRISGLSVPPWMTSDPVLQPPTPTDDIIVTASALLGLAQALGTLTRARLGIVAAYGWWVAVIAISWRLALSSPVRSPLQIGAAFVWSAMAICFMIYYHRRRSWFHGDKR